MQVLNITIQLSYSAVSKLRNFFKSTGFRILSLEDTTSSILNPLSSLIYIPTLVMGFQCAIELQGIHIDYAIFK
ncbi:hypothetical protein KO116_01950 [Halomonas sp. KO116]|nr:hypothetical protein KO116_01950 [Halomonas sp. KO116]